MGRNFFWWSYSEAYETRQESRYINTHERDMVVSLCCWLVCNHVEATNIAVLTPYRGQVIQTSLMQCIILCQTRFWQLEEIKRSLEDRANAYRNVPKMLRDIDVYTVDEYQVSSAAI